MAEALISVILEQLVSISREQIEQQVRLVVNVDKEVDNLISHFRAVKAVLQDAEERRVKDENVKNWLQDLEHVSYEMDDVLDEWNSEILKYQIENEEKEGENSLRARRKVRFFIPSPGVCFGRIGKVIRRRDIAKTIQELNEKLTSIDDIRKKYNFADTIRVDDRLEVRPETTCFVDVSEIIGREKEKSRVISMLLSETSQERRGLVVIPIVGMGGLGKTAFAQLVYNDAMVETHFDTRIWVCVSDPFDEIKIAKAMIEVINKHDSRKNSTALQPLLECINESIKRKKFLLVLDDVWNPTFSSWEPLKGALQNSDVGSRILMTTRIGTVATIMGATTNHIIHLNILGDQDCLLLFNKIAFFDKKRDDQLETIGKKIVNKCNGLPLAAKTLASLMRYKNTRQEWLHVLDSKIWEQDEVGQQVFKSLFLSYYDLIPGARRCLLYCATFPKDYVFNRDILIELWMSQGYLSMGGDKKQERLTGQTYFHNLAMRSFFQDFEKDEDDNVVGSKMHDIVHDFVQFLAKNECLVVEAEDSNPRNKVLDNKVRHLNFMSFVSSGSFPYLTNAYNCKRLRTLLAFGSGIDSLTSDFILQLLSLRTLDLSRNFLEQLPKEIGALVHLRYLDLSKNENLKELPDTVGNLINLQTLRVTRCYKLEKLPGTIGKLINLKHLYNEDDFNLKLPKEIGRLTSLQRLDLLLLDEHGGGDGHDSGGVKLGDLRNLDQLQGTLWIRNLRLVKGASEASGAQLVNKENLACLHLDFATSLIGDIDEKREVDQETLNALEPPSNLGSFYISHYDGPTLNLNWMMSLHHLKRLEVYCLRFCEVLAPLGKFPSLEYLKIDYMSSLKKVGVNFLGMDDQPETTQTISFPKLKFLEFQEMGKWEEWEGVEDEHTREADSEISIMPALSSLTIFKCHSLKALPDFLWKTPLQKLSITYCSILEESLAGREWDKVSHIPNIQINLNIVQKDRVRAEPKTTEN